MSSTKFCSGCGNKLDAGTSFCGHCGAKLGADSSVAGNQLVKSDKSGLAAFLLCLFFGSLGIHRFYVGKIGTGILMLLTGGGLGLWYLYDLVSIVCNNFTDKKGNVVEIAKNPSAAKKTIMVVGSLFAGFIVLIVLFIVLVAIFLGGLADVAQNELAALRAGDVEKAYSYTSKDFRNETSLRDFKKFVQHYPFLKNNESASFPEREIKNNIGMVRGTLKLNDGTTIPIEMQFIKEDNEWKVLGIHINPAGGAKSE